MSSKGQGVNNNNNNIIIIVIIIIIIIIIVIIIMIMIINIIVILLILYFVSPFGLDFKEFTVWWFIKTSSVLFYNCCFIFADKN